MLISSRQNEKIKRIKSLSRKGNRYEEKCYVAEGLKPVREAISHNAGVLTVLGIPEMIEKLPLGEWEIITCTPDVYESVSDEMNPEGVLAVIAMPDTSVKKPNGAHCIFLDGLADPGNVGTIIRTAAAAGYRDVYMSDCADPFNLKTVRSSMSGIFFVNLNVGSREEIIQTLDMPIISADMDGEDVFSFVAPARFCLAVGSEAEGLSRAVREASRFTVKIPMEKDTESLNVGVSAGILMYILR